MAPGNLCKVTRQISNLEDILQKHRFKKKNSIESNRSFVQISGHNELFRRLQAPVHAQKNQQKPHYYSPAWWEKQLLVLEWAHESLGSAIQ
jgi:hypothetical protein